MAGISRPVVHVGIVAGLVLFLGLAVVNASQPDGTHPGWIGSAVVVGLGLLGYLVVVRPWQAWRRPDSREHPAEYDGPGQPSSVAVRVAQLQAREQRAGRPLSVEEHRAMDRADASGPGTP